MLFQLLFITGISYFHYIFRVIIEVADVLNVKVSEP